VPLALCIPPQVFLVHLQLSELYMAWLHTEVIDTLGPLELILNTPSHHRVHHSRNPEYIDKNYGGMLIIWDRLFGTFKSEDKGNAPVYGLVHPVRSFNPIQVQFHPWPIIWRRMMRAKTWTHKLGVLFYGPGWRPGINRLGNIEDIPKLKQPIVPYDPPLSAWKKLYVVAHFGILLLFYHELTLHQKEFPVPVLNAGVLALLVSIISLGLILDGKRYCAVYELVRCLMLIQARHYLIPVISRTQILFAWNPESHLG
jgi:alkylglycerol monooxygenase